jgi:hypothetical protein
MSIKSDVDELQHVNLEIKRTNDALKKLRDTKHTIEERIANFLKDKDLPGVKYNQNVILLQQKNSSKVKPKKIRQSEMLDLLADSGVSDPESLLKKINAIGKQKITKDVIKIDRRV